VTGAIVFKEDQSQTDDAYRAYLRANPGTFVLNARRNPKPDYLVIHRSDCPLVTTYRNEMGDGAFTQRHYIKVCGPTIESLRQWVRVNFGVADFSSENCHCLRNAVS
jgi:hypothetical protein